MRFWSACLFSALLAALATGCSGNTVAQTTGPSPTRCQPSLAGVPTSVPASGASVTATISTTRDCTWNVTTDANWVQVDPNAGQGDASITVVVAANTVTSSRSATISVNGATASVSEAGAPPPPPPPPKPAPAPTPTPTPTPNPAPAPAPNPNPPAPAPAPSPTPATFKGQVSNLSGSCPSLAFVAAGHQVRTDSATKFVPGACSDVRNGVDVTIDGQLLPNGVVQATQVNVKKK